MSCGFTATKTFTVYRAAQSPSFSSTNPAYFCNTTGSLSIDPVCGATSYTYTITGNPGITFSANGLQTLTTTGNSVGLSLSGSTSTSELKVKANYPGPNTSAEVSSSFNYGSVAPGPISILLADGTTGKIIAQTTGVPGATSYNWYINGVSQNRDGLTASMSIGRGNCGGYEVSVEAVHPCGTSALVYKEVDVPCDFYTISPNPASSIVNVSFNENMMLSASQSSYEMFDEVRIYDINGNLKKLQKVNKAKSAAVDVSGLQIGTYYVEVSSGTYKERQQILIQR